MLCSFRVAVIELRQFHHVIRRAFKKGVLGLSSAVSMSTLLQIEDPVCNQRCTTTGYTL